MLDVVVKNDIKVKTIVFHGIREIPRVVGLLRHGRYHGKDVIVIDENAKHGVQGRAVMGIGGMYHALSLGH